MRRYVAGAVLATVLAVGGAVAFAEGESSSGTAGRRAAGSGLQDLAGRLNARERALERREKSLETRETDLKEAEKRLQERLTELQAIRAELDDRLAALDERDEQRRVSLTEMTEKMRPKDAAPFLATLDRDLAVDVLNRMQTAKAGKVLAAMPPETAADLAQRLTAPTLLEQ